MWNQEKQQRLDALRVREAEERLPEEERAELETLFAELDAEEAEALRPALERMQHQQTELLAEKKHLRAEAVQLERIIHAQEQLLVPSAMHIRGLTGTKLIRPPFACFIPSMMI